MTEYINFYEKVKQLGLTSINVGWTRFEIEFAPVLDGANSAEDSLGLSDVNYHKIYILQDMPDDIAKEVFFHELIHVMNATSGLAQDECSLNEEERTVQTTRGLLILFNLNKRLKELL